MKNVLMYTMHNPQPEGGGISRMAYNIGLLLEESNCSVFYISYNKIETVNSVRNQYFFPDANPNSEKNYYFLKSFINEHRITTIINHISTNEQYSSILLDNDYGDVKILSMIHNCVLNHIKNFAYQKEYNLKWKGYNFIFSILKSSIASKLMVALCKLKYRRYYRKLEKNSDYIVLVSENNIVEMQEMLGHKSNKLVSVSNFIVPSDSVCEPKEKIVIWCGRIETFLKRTDIIIDVWSAICKKHHDWKLYIMGDGNIKEMQAYTLKKEVNNCLFTGRVDVQSYYKKASIICHTSISESFGLVLVEAMSNGVVPVAFNSFPSCQDIIPDEVGLKIPAFNVQMYADELGRLLDNPQRIKELSQNAIRHSVNYHKDSIKSQWLQIIS